MTTLIQNEQKRQKIMARMREHLVPVLEHCRGGWVGLFLQGSQNYNLDYEGSDIDTKAIMLPSFSDFVLNAKPLSTTHIMENNEHVDFKDIRLMFDCIKKQNVNFVEILFTPYSIINPEYADLFQPVLDAREEIARYNNYAGMNCIMGMALEKQKAMEHPYPATMDKIEAFGYDPKQLHHALRLREFMTRYEAGEPYADCLISNQCDYLKEVKRGCYSLKEARALMSTAIQSMTEDKKRYMDTVPVSINQHANEVLQKATMMLSNPKLHRYNIIWDKVLKSGFLNAKKMPLREHEDIMVFYKSPPPYHPQMTVGEKNHTKGKAVGKQAEDVHSNRSYGNYTLVESPDGNMKYPASIWRFPKPHPSVALHATEKPVDLLRYAIRTYTDRNAIVLDNCCGTGSTLIAAKLEGRRYIGIDNGVCDKKKSPYYGMPWAQVAQIRLEAIDHEPADEPERHRPLGEGTTEGVCTPSGVSA